MIVGPNIYTRDSSGNIRTWYYEIDGNKWRGVSGILGGALITSGWTVCERPKSQPTVEEQAIFEAMAEMTKKLKVKYVRDLDSVDTVVRGTGIKPMLAKKYKDYGWRGPCYSQPKLDGIRSLISKDIMCSREFEPIVSCPHIREDLESFFEAFPDTILDGEFYNHSLKDDFNSIQSLITTKNITPEFLEKTKSLVQYHVFDVIRPDKQDFACRSSFLDVFEDYSPHIVKVETRLITSEKDLDEYYTELLLEGYEGQMIRSNTPYVQKRTDSLLKRKGSLVEGEFQDDEFPFVRFVEGKGSWSGYAKRVTCRLPNGEEFGAGIKGTQEFCRELLSKTFGSVTVRFQNYTPDGKPRFGVAIAFHDEHREF